jgi:ABC-type multidrug transport system ATPase subunit
MPNRFTILYQGKDLQHHSLEQKASAFMLFLPRLGQNDVIIIDQPDNDLDNQTIYEDVIKMIRKLKPNVQFIFATHNPNIPVLGNAEQTHAVEFIDDKIEVQCGSIDAHTQQKSIIDIMEGGKEAFDKRKEIYQIWKS